MADFGINTGIFKVDFTSSEVAAIRQRLRRGPLHDHSGKTRHTMRTSSQQSPQCWTDTVNPDTASHGPANRDVPRAL